MTLENVKVAQILPLQEGQSAKGAWKLQTYIVETAGNYPRKIAVECFGNNADKIELEPGQVVSLNVDVESREYNGRWYTSCRAWSIASSAQNAPAASTSAAVVPTAPAQQKQASSAPVSKPSGAVDPDHFQRNPLAASAAAYDEGTNLPF